jgi:GNAT superfamily N-acetyltransferase
MTCQFQPATVAELETVLELVRAYYELDGIRFEAPRIRRALTELLTTPALGGAWLIREDQSLLGYFVLTFGFDLEFGGRQATVTELYLTPSGRGRGIGTRTLLFVEETLRELGIGAFELQAERSNIEALAFYAKFGMKTHDRIPLSKEIPRAPRVSTK